jgi:hypothetical protein
MMSGPITPEAAADIDAAVEATLDQYPDAEILRQPLRAWLRRRWPAIVKSAVTTEAST